MMTTIQKWGNSQEARAASYLEAAPDDIIDEAIDLICSFVE